MIFFKLYMIFFKFIVIRNFQSSFGFTWEKKIRSRKWWVCWCAPPLRPLFLYSPEPLIILENATKNSPLTKIRLKGEIQQIVTRSLAICKDLISNQAEHNKEKKKTKIFNQCCLFTRTSVTAYRIQYYMHLICRIKFNFLLKCPFSLSFRLHKLSTNEKLTSRKF